jgi:hypothetical protein
MLRKMRQTEASVMLGICLAGMLCAQQRITSSDVTRLQQQYAREMRELQSQKVVSQRESKHVVKVASVVEFEAKREQEANRMETTEDQKTKGNPRSAEEKAKMVSLMKEVNAKLPEMNALLKQASSNSTLSKIEMKPLKVDDVLSSVGGNGSTGKTLEQQTVQQAMQKSLQEEMKKMDPQTRSQVKALLKAAEEGKLISLPQAVPSRSHTQLLTKGAL